MDNQQRAQALIEGLGLTRPPVALAFIDDAPPAGVAGVDAAAPSSCTFWRRAESAVFYASAETHFECPVGSMTMGFELPVSAQQRAQELIGTMVGLEYLSMDELPHLPSVQRAARGILYGPLAAIPAEPDAVLVIVSPYQGMLLAESGDAVALAERPGLVVMGRPACAAVARTVTEGGPTLSLGCVGARTYVELPDDKAIYVLPGGGLDRVIGRLATMNHANTALAEFHGQQKAAIAG